MRAGMLYTCDDGQRPRPVYEADLWAMYMLPGYFIHLDEDTRTLCLVRAMSREPGSLEAVKVELEFPRGRNGHYDAHIERLYGFLKPGALHEGTARSFAGAMARALQAAALARSAPDFVFNGYCETRLDPARPGFVYGELPESVDQDAIIARARPAV